MAALLLLLLIAPACSLERTLLVVFSVPAMNMDVHLLVLVTGT
jgi:hypothetical protein